MSLIQKSALTSACRRIKLLIDKVIEGYSDMARILLIDDDRLVRQLLRTVLEDVGHVVEEATDGRQGLKKFHQEPFDLVIVDIFMPRVDGLQTIIEMKESHPHMKSIAISGGGLTKEMAFLSYAKTFGADRIFSKPLDMKEFMKATEELIGPGVSSQ